MKLINFPVLEPSVMNVERLLSKAVQFAEVMLGQPDVADPVSITFQIRSTVEPVMSVLGNA